MRATTLLLRVLGITDFFVVGFSLEYRKLILRVRPRWRNPRCGECGHRGCTHYDTMSKARRWLHLPIGRTAVYFEYRLRRVFCERCGGVRVEQVPWAAHDCRHTRELEEMVAYLAQLTDKSKVSKLMGIAWESVDRIVQRIVASRLDERRFDGLTEIGVDEFSYRKRHRYITVVVDHVTRRVIYSAEGRSSETLGTFFEMLGEDRRKTIRVVTMDMAQTYIKAVRAALPNATIVFDRFHVQKLMSEALDEVRRETMRAIESSLTRREVFRSRFSLLRSERNRTEKDESRLANIRSHYEPIHRAWTLKEELANIFDRARSKDDARLLLLNWVSWAERSRLGPIVKLAKTVRSHFVGILAYFDERLTNGLVEGINNRLRMIARRAFGYATPTALIAMLFLCCGGIELQPPLPNT